MAADLIHDLPGAPAHPDDPVATRVQDVVVRGRRGSVDRVHVGEPGVGRDEVPDVGRERGRRGGGRTRARGGKRDDDERERDSERTDSRPPADADPIHVQLPVSYV